MALGLPVELIFQIAGFLSKNDLSALVRTDRQLHDTLNPCLWQQNANSALSWAAEHGDQQAARKAFKHGAQINTGLPPTDKSLARPTHFGSQPKLHSRSGHTPLLLAVAAGQKKMVDFLLQVDGIDPNSHDNPDSLTPLTLATLVEDEDIVRTLLSVEGIDPTINYSYIAGDALIIASYLGLVGIAKLLLTHGSVNPNKGNIMCQSPIYLAALEGHTAMVKVLLQAGASPHPPEPEDVLAWGGWYGDPLVHAVEKSAEMLEAMVNSPLFDASRFLDRVPPYRCEAMQKNRVEIFKILFALSSDDINWHQDGRTALFWAAVQGHEEALRMLLSVDGIEVNIQGRGILGPDMTPYYVSLLEERGMIGHGEGITPLIIAARYGHVGAVQLLLAVNGVDLHHQDTTFGETALMAARSNGHNKVVELLQCRTVTADHYT